MREAIERSVAIHNKLMHTFESSAATLGVIGSPALQRFPLTRRTLTHPDLSHGAHQPRVAHTTAALRTRAPGTSWGPPRGHPVRSAPVHRTQSPPRRCRSPAGTLTCWCRPAMGPASLVLLRPGAMSVGDTRQCQRSHRPLGLVEANPRKIAQNSSGQRRY
jgi:hypothetical protein